MFNSSAWLVNLWSCLACNDYVTTLCEIKQIVREWAEFSYKAMFTCSFFVEPILKNNNNCWPFFDVQRFERSNKLTVHSDYLFVTIAFCVRRIFNNSSTEESWES